MKSFLQYLSEVFQPSEKQYTPADRSHPDKHHDLYDSVAYRHTIPAVNGGKDTNIHTSFREIDPDADEYAGAWKVSFSVDGKYHKETEKTFPSHISKVVFDHVNHFVKTRQPGREGLVFITDDPKKSRIYHAVAKRLKVGIRQAKIDDRGFG